MQRVHRMATAAAATTVLPLLGGGCAGSNSGGAKDDVTQDVTITFWHGYSAPSEVKAIKANVANFEAKNPKIHVKVVGNIDDDKINQALRAGGTSAPDLVSSFTTDNKGRSCSSNVLIDLQPFLAGSGAAVD